jgi:CheY-like chemotaxis protein
MSNPSFLYVEDDPPSRMIVKVLLTRVMGFSELAVFEDSTDFMTRVCALPVPPNVIFLDIQMKPHDGYQVLKMLRTDDRFKDAVIIAMTANVMQHDVEELRKAGFSGLIGKPIMKEIFPELVEKILTGEQVWYIP